MPKTQQYGPGVFVPPGAMLEAARGPAAMHAGSHKADDVPSIVIQMEIRNGKPVFVYRGPKDLPPGLHTVTLVVVE